MCAHFPNNRGQIVDRYSVDMDIGGTFTDAIFSRKGFAKLIKVDTTPHDLSVCFISALEKARKELEFENLRQFLSHVRVIRLSTSLSTNVLMEGKGSCIGLILETGWRDAFLLQSVFPEGARSPVAQEMVLEIGNKPEVEEIRAAAYRLIMKGADVLVISLNPPGDFHHAEQHAKGTIYQFYANHFIGSIPVITSGQLSRAQDYIKRSSRIVSNTYVDGAVTKPFLEIEDHLREHGYAYPLLLVHSDWGSSRVSKTMAEQTINSGASAAIFGAKRFSELYELKNVIIVDIGGTSTEIGVIKEGRIARTQSDPEGSVTALGGLHTTITVGIGGGSVIRIDETGRVEFGPKSVGAFPGPACYGLGGTEATLTDAFLLLGYFDEDYFLGGERRLKRGLAEAVFRERIAGLFGTSCEEAAWKVKQEAVKRIAGKILGVLSRHGLEPSDTALFAVGGGGGCMGCDLCGVTGFGEVHVFRQGSAFGAYGSSGMDVVHRYEEELPVGLCLTGRRGVEVCEAINKTVLALQRKAFQDMAAEGFQAEAVHFELRVVVEAKETRIRQGYDCPSVFLWPGEWNMVRKGILRLFMEDDAKLT
jgi:N-methylhydantoinase A/oxoprolinase/acetone carboxylase beta subunit